MKWPRVLPPTQIQRGSLISFVQNQCLPLQEQPDDDDDNADEFDRHWSERDMAAYDQLMALWFKDIQRENLRDHQSLTFRQFRNLDLMQARILPLVDSSNAQRVSLGEFRKLAGQSLLGWSLSAARFGSCCFVISCDFWSLPFLSLFVPNQMGEGNLATSWTARRCRVR